MAASYPQVILLGDSLFEISSSVEDGFSFHGALQALCIRRYDVVNRGFSGYNTSQALRLLPQIFPAAAAAASPPEVACLFVLLGANDAALTQETDNQHVDLDAYEANLKAIVTHPNIAGLKPGKIVIVSPPPLDGIKWAAVERQFDPTKTSASRKAPVTAKYAEAARRVATSVPGVSLLDLWAVLMDLAIARTPDFDPSSGILLGDEDSGKAGYLDKLLSDGLHLSAEGYRVFFEQVRQLIDVSVPIVHPPWQTAPWLEE